MSVLASRLIPKTLRHCPLCQKETPHEIREGSGMIVTVCVSCLERALSYELDRE
jgi:hypothetical protein